MPEDAADLSSVSEDSLLGGDVILRQPRDGFRVAIDTVLVAAAVPATAGARIVEPGSGAGAAALCLARRVPGVRVTGLEKRAALVNLATQNASKNGLEETVDFHHGDIAAPPAVFEHAAFDHAMMNPPFLPASRADAPARADRLDARIEDAAGLDAWIAFALAALRPKGTLTLVHRADRIDEALALLHGRAGEITVFPLWPKADGRPAKRVLIGARQGVRTPARMAAGLVLHEEDGSYTAAAEAVLRGAALELWKH